MPILAITNNTTSPSRISDPDTAFNEEIPASATTTWTVSEETLNNINDQLDDLRTRVDSNGDRTFVIDVQSETDADDLEHATIAALIHWTGNHINLNSVVSNPDTASVVSARRVNIAAGEAVIDGEFFVYSASVDEAGDAEIDVDGVDVSAVDLADDEDVYMHVLMVNNAGTREVVFVRGTGVDNTGDLSAVALTRAELDAAVGAYLGLTTSYRNYVNVATVLFEESAGLTQTTTSLHPIPGAYN